MAVGSTARQYTENIWSRSTSNHPLGVAQYFVLSTLVFLSMLKVQNTCLNCLSQAYFLVFNFEGSYNAVMLVGKKNIHRKC